MRGYVLGQRLLLFLLHHGLVVGVVGVGPQTFPLHTSSSCFSFTLSANCAVARTSGAEAAETFPHSAASSRRSAWPTSGRRPPCERGHPCGDTAEILRTTHSSASTP